MSPELIQAVGYASAFVFLAVAAVLAVVLAVSAVAHRRDGGYRWIGDPAPPPERRSPFAPSHDDDAVGAPCTLRPHRRPTDAHRDR